MRDARRSRELGDAGRFPVGALLALAAVGLAAYGAYWFLGQYGFLGETQAGASATPTVATTEEADGRPEWLQGTPYEMPPLVDPEDDREPDSYLLQDWIWELVDDDWSLEVFREGEGDNYTWLSDVQVLFLVSPTEELFKISDLRTDFNMELVHWDPELEISWLRRAGKSDREQVIQYDLRTLETTEDWAGNAVSSANTVQGGVANVEFRGVQTDDRELWVSYDEKGAATGVFWRLDGEFESSLISDKIRRMVQQGLSADQGVEAWFDVKGGRAVYHGVYYDPNTGAPAEDEWVTQDLLTDSYEDHVVVDAPVDDCQPVGGHRSGRFDGNRIVAVCGAGEYLLDPYDGKAYEGR